MTILFAGGEMDAFSPSDSTVVEDTTSGRFNSAFARCAVKCPNRLTFATGTASASVTDGWLHFEWFSFDKSGTNSFQPLIVWCDSSGNQRVRILQEPTLDQIYMDYWNGSGWTQAGSTISIDTTALNVFDLHGVVNTASGSLDLYIAGTLRITSGTVNLTGITNLKIITLYGWGDPGNVAAGWTSQVIMADQVTIGMRLMTAYLSGAGANSEWGSGTFASIDEVVYDDLDFISSGTANQVQMMATTLQSVLSGYTIVAIAVGSRAKRDSGGPQNLQLGVRIGSTNYFSSTKSLGVAYAPTANIWNTSPATSVAWVSSEISSLQIGDKSIA